MNLVTSLLTLVGWVLWGYVVLFVGPGVPGAPLAFYATLFLALTFTLSRLMAAGAPDDRDEEGRSGAPSLGHAAIVSILILFALWLQSLRMLTSLNGILLAAMFAFVELGFFMSGGGRRKPRARRRPPRGRPADPGLAGETQRL